MEAFCLFHSIIIFFLKISFHLLERKLDQRITDSFGQVQDAFLKVDTANRHNVGFGSVVLKELDIYICGSSG